MIAVFDLDDTLYDEFSYVRSALANTARFIKKTYGLPEKNVRQEMLNLVNEDRNGVFDRLLKKHGMYSKRKVRQLIRVYRRTKPRLTLFPAADRLLVSLKKDPVYIVTDGNKNVQAAKIAALGLKRRVDHAFITYRYGRKHAKPSPYCFMKICSRHRADPSQVVYIADNPAKDFVGIKPLGFRTVRVLQGAHMQVKADKAHEADAVVPSLSSVSRAMLYRLTGEHT